MHRFLTAATCLTILSFGAPSEPLRGGEDDPVLRSRFLKGVSQAEQALAQFSLRAKCSVRWRLISVSEETRAADAKHNRDPFAEDVYEFECAVRGPLCLQRLKDKRGQDVIRVRNESYAFSIARSPKGGLPTLQFLEQVGVNPSVDVQIADVEREVRVVALGGYHLFGDALYNVVRSNDFRLHRVYAVQADDGWELVRAEFDYTARDRPRVGFHDSYTNGFVICDPSRAWIMTEYGADCHVGINKARLKQHVTLQYGESLSHIPIAEKTEVKTTYLTESLTVSSTAQSTRVVEVLGDGEVPKEEFYLSFYGLPEPNFRRGWFGAWVWYLLVGAVCLAIGAILLKRRQARG